MRLFIYVEGQEEEMFVNRVLRAYLLQFGIIVQKPILAATSFRIGGDDVMVSVGGVTNYASIHDDIVNLFATGEITSSDALTTLIDLYALPISFPGHDETKRLGLTGSAKATHIENAWKMDITHPNFFPYIQVHEFEALILTRPSVLKDYYPEHSAGIEQLRGECATFLTPEDINEHKETSPSHRIIKHVPPYLKLDGFRHLQDIGLQEITARCPRFETWIRRCEAFFR